MIILRNNSNSVFLELKTKFDLNDPIKSVLMYTVRAHAHRRHSASANSAWQAKLTELGSVPLWKSTWAESVNGSTRFEDQLTENLSAVTF